MSIISGLCVLYDWDSSRISLAQVLLASNLPRLPEMGSGGLGQLSNRWDREQSTRVGNERGSWSRNSKLQLESPPSVLR